MQQTILKALGSALLLCLSTNTFATNKALLIGVSSYQGKYDQLEGPEYDVSALKKTLQQHWGFKSVNIKTLVNYDATRENILKELTALKDNAQANDQIFIYFSGHGTSVYDKKSPQGPAGLPSLYSNSGAIVPYGYLKKGLDKQSVINSLIIGKRDLRPIFLELDKKQAHVFMAFDSCFSGSANRGQLNSLPSRTPKINVNSYDEEDEDMGYPVIMQQSEPYPYHNIVFFSAASPKEKAKDIPRYSLSKNSTLDNEPHGAFTDALLRGMSGKLNTDTNKDGKTDYRELLVAVKTFMNMRGYPHDPYISPALTEDHRSLSLLSVLGQHTSLSSAASTVSALLSVSITPPDPELINALKQRPHLKISASPADLNLQKLGRDYQLRNKAGDLITTLRSLKNPAIVDRVQHEALIKHFRQTLQQRASINIDMAVKEGLSGNTVELGDTLAFSVRSEKPVYLVLLNVNSKGVIEPLYPYFSHETRVIPAQQVKYIPSINKQDWILVQEPVGVDHLIALGFAQEPPFLKEFIKKEVLLLHSDLYKKLMKYTETAQFAYAELDVLTVAKPKD